MDLPVLADRQKLIYISSVQTQDAGGMDDRDGWRERERESRNFDDDSYENTSVNNIFSTQ